MRFPLVYVLVINWNGLRHLGDCFDTLLRSSYPNFRALLVDNASTDGSVQEAQRRYGHDPRVEILPLDSNRNWGGGNNAGIERALEAGAEYLFLLNNDTWTDPSAIGILVAAAEAQPMAAALAPKMLLFDTPLVLNSVGVTISTIGAAWDIGVGRADRAQYDTPTEVPAVCGGAMFLRAEALRKVGLIDEDFGIYYDDVDLCLRFWQAGFSCVTCPEARIGHKFSASTGDSSANLMKKIALIERNRLRCLLLNFPTAMLLRALPLLALGEIRAAGSAVRDGAFWRLRAQSQAWSNMLRGLSRLRALRKGRSKAVYQQKLNQLPARGRMFCPAVYLPRAGVYPSQEYLGAPYNPCASHFSLQLPDSILKFRVCDAHLNLLYEGPINASSNGEHFGFSGNQFTFHSGSIRTAEETGLAFDVGGFLQCFDAEGRQVDLFDKITPHALPKELETPPHD